jgi:hypothetical protein
VQERRLRLKRPKSVFCNSFIFSNLRTRGLEITRLYRTFLVDPEPRGLLGVTPSFVKNCTLRGKFDWKRLAPKWSQLAISKAVSADKFQIARREAVALNYALCAEERSSRHVFVLGSKTLSYPAILSVHLFTNGGVTP